MPYPLGKQVAIKPKRVNQRRTARFDFFDPIRNIALDRFLADTNLGAGDTGTGDSVVSTAGKVGLLGSIARWDIGRGGYDPMSHEGYEYRCKVPELEWGRAVRDWSYARAEPFEFWRYHVTRLRTLIDVRRMIVAKDAEGLVRLWGDVPTVSE